MLFSWIEVLLRLVMSQEEAFMVRDFREAWLRASADRVDTPGVSGV